MLELEKKREKVIFVKEPFEFVKGKYKLNLLALKVLGLIFNKIDPFTDQDFKKYEITVQEIQNKIGKDYGNTYNYIKKTIIDLMKIVIQLENDEQWKPFTLLVEPTLFKKSGVIKFWISPALLELLKKSKHYLVYNIEILAYFNSSYALRLYKILRDRYEINKKFNTSNFYEIDLEEFKDMFQLSYKRYSNIKQKVIKPALAEINAYSDINVRLEEIKKGRKVEKLLFYISSKKDPKSFVTPPKKKQEEKFIANDLKQFRQEIIQKFNNKEKYFIIDDNLFKIKEDLLFINDEALKASEALTWWKYIYKNKDKIKEIDPQEEAKKVWKETLEKINNIYKGKITLISIGGEYKEAEILKIEGEALDNLETYFKDLETNKIYTANYSLQTLKTL